MVCRLSRGGILHLHKTAALSGQHFPGYKTGEKKQESGPVVFLTAQFKEFH